MSYYLECISGSLKGKRVNLRPKKAITFGRDRASTARIHDRKLSRIHCQFELVGEEVVLTDLNSTNGTYVNGKRIDDVVLKVGDTVQLGRVKMLLQSDEPAQPASGGDAAPEQERVGDCEECSAPVGKEDLDAGRARRAGRRMYCAQCSARFAPRPEQADADSGEPTPQAVETVRQDLEPGAEFAGVRVLERIGDGRCGPVYLAEQPETGRHVSLKVLELGAKAARRYMDALYASGQLVHNNIVLLYDSGEAEGRHYVIREHVEGESLDALLEREGSLPLQHALAIAMQAADGLRHAKERGLSHGALAPPNILLAADGTAKLANFGVDILAGPGFPDPREDARLLPYLAPETLRRPERPPEFPSDCYSLGAVFFRMLAGHPPFEAPDAEALLKRLEGEPAPHLADIVGDLPVQAGQIVERCLDKNPGARYQHPRELLNDFEALLHAHS